jgi:hypothetical protein
MEVCCTSERGLARSRHSALRVTVVVAAICAPLLWLRTKDGLGRLPSDPGYDYFIAARQRGWQSIWSPDPFPQVISRFVAWCAAQFSFPQHALIAGILTNAFWVVSAMAIGYVVLRQWKSVLLAVSAGTLLILSPVAQESALLNHGNLKWPLLSVAIVALSCPTFIRSYAGPTAGLLVFAGLSQPVIFVAAIPVLITVLFDRNRSLRTAVISLSAVVVGVAYQVVVTGLDRSTTGHGASRILHPWPGMGVFWWFGLIGPLVVSLAAIALSLRGTVAGDEAHISIFALATSSIALSVSTYLLGGIADRYFVAPMFLSSLGAMFVMWNMWTSGNKWLQAIVLLGIISMMLPSLHWFSASSWLISGPLWSDEAERAREHCAIQGVFHADLGLTPNGVTTVSCRDIRPEHND